LGVEVEVVEPPRGGQASETLEAGVAARFGGGHFSVEEHLEERGVAELVRAGVVEHAGQRFGRGGEAQVGELGAQLLVDGVLAHQPASCPRVMSSTMAW
jgi:hypothetical protein